MKTTKYAVLTASQHFGMGQTIAEAAKNANLAGARRTEAVLAYLYIGEPEELKEVRVTSYGDIEHPENVTSTRLFGPKDCSIKLRNLLSSK